MNRRAYLASLALASGLAGCQAGVQRTSTETATRTPPPTVEEVPFAELGFPPTVCSEPIHEGAILAIDDPVFGPDWSGIDVPAEYVRADGFTEESVVVGLTDGDRARAYPVQVLWHHEIVNDSFGGPVIVTYCPNCRSGLVAERRVGGEETTFGVTGLLWEAPAEYTGASELDGTTFALGSDRPASVLNSGNLVMYDEATGSYWSQIVGRGICGPHEGETLTILPSTVATWGDWLTEHPDSEVLLPPPHSGTLEP